MSTSVALDSPAIASRGAAVPAAAVLPHGTEVLAFRLGADEYGLDLMQVQDVLAHDAATHGVTGVMHLRGAAIPRVDLRVLLGLPARPVHGETVALVVAFGGRSVALVADGVSDVVSFSPAQLRAASGAHARLDRRHVLGLGAVGRRTLVLVDLERLLAEPSLGLVTH